MQEQDQMQDEMKAAEAEPTKKPDPRKTEEDIAAEKAAAANVQPEKSDGKSEGKAEGPKPAAESPPIGKPSYPQDALLTCQLRVVDLAEMVHESVRACIFKDAQPWIRLTNENRMDVMTLVMNVLNHRTPTPATVQGLINKILKPADARPLHQLAPHEQHLAHMIYGIVLGFKKQE